MRLEVLGTNAAFAAQGVTNSFILWQNNNSGILLDCGFSVYQELRQKGYADKIDTVLISHLHQDHCGSVVNLLDYRYKILGLKTALGGTDCRRFLELHSGNGWQEKVMPLPDDIRVDCFTVPHAKGMDCYALFINHTLLYSGDSAISILDSAAAAEAKMIIHDVSLKGGGIIVGIDELSTAKPEIKAKTFVSHYLPKDYETLCQIAHKSGLGGVLRQGMTFEI